MKEQKVIQYYFWRFQCIIASMVFIPSLIVVAILVNFHQGFKYETTGAIFNNHEFNNLICVSIIMGVLSLLLSTKPDFITSIEKRFLHYMNFLFAFLNLYFLFLYF